MAVLPRIGDALVAATDVLATFRPGAVDYEVKSSRGDEVTAADHAADAVLHERLLRDGEGWLSEETRDDPSRLDRRHVWVVDPLDGTREFVQGLPEWCVSVAFVDAGRAVAGGICNPAAGHTVVGAIGSGVELNGRPAQASQRPSLEGARVLASRSEVKRGEWARFDDAPFEVVAMGSVAYKLACVAAGLADATWTLVPKNEWDVAAGAALVEAAGGRVCTLDGAVPRFNRADTLFDGLIATGPALMDEVRAFLELDR